jgi:hypothetical protein
MGAKVLFIGVLEYNCLPRRHGEVEVHGEKGGLGEGLGRPLRRSIVRRSKGSKLVSRYELGGSFTF